MIRSFTDQSALDALRADLDAAYRTICAKHGLLPSRAGSMKYTDNNVIVKSEFNVDPTLERTRPALSSFTAYETELLAQYGLKVGMILRSSKFGNCTITGWNTRSPKYPIKTITTDGKPIKFNAESARHSVVKGLIQA